MGNTLLVLSEGALAALAETAVAVGITDLVLQQLFFAILAFWGVGLFFRRSNEAVQRRLGLESPTRQQLFVGLRWIPLLVLLQWLITLIWVAIDPEQVQQLEDISGNLLGNVDSLWEWFALSLSAGIGEEILFRGALQPVLGLWFTGRSLCCLPYSIWSDPSYAGNLYYRSCTGYHSSTHQHHRRYRGSFRL